VSRIFVDTGAFVAKEVAGDQYHAGAVRGWEEVWRKGIQLVSSQHVFDESATLIARRTTYAFAAQWGLDALGSGIGWLAAGEEDCRGALELMRKFADQGVSFTDCLSVVLMRRSGVKRVFGFDRHFVAMGLRVWPVEAG
jgi:predicted nucleic acid-binding protein